MVASLLCTCEWERGAEMHAADISPGMHMVMLSDMGSANEEERVTLIIIEEPTAH